MIWNTYLSPWRLYWSTHEQSRCLFLPPLEICKHFKINFGILNFGFDKGNARTTLSHFWISSPVPSKTFLRSLLVASGATLPIKIFTGFLMSEKMAQYHGSKVSYMLESSTFSHLPLYESPSSFLTAFSAPFGVVQYIHQLKYMLWSTKSSHYYLLIIHVNKSDWLVRQFVGLRDIAIPGVWRLFKTIQE